MSIILSAIAHFIIVNFDDQLEMKMPGVQVHRFDSRFDSHQLSLIAKKANPKHKIHMPTQILYQLRLSGKCWACTGECSNEYIE